MPRDGSGIMTLPAGNPVVAGTTISPTVHNATIADLAAEIQDSLSRSGKGGMNSPLKYADGNVGAPSITFTNDTTSGVYRSGAGEVSVSILGVLVATIRAAGAYIAGALSFSDSAAINIPSAGKTLSLQTNSVSRLTVSDTSVAVTTTPTNATDVATKGYVDTLVGTTSAPSEATVTASTGWTITGGSPGGYFYAYKSGNLVALAGVVTVTNIATAVSTSVVTIPAGYRPKAAQYRFPVEFYDTGSGNYSHAYGTINSTTGVVGFTTAAGAAVTLSLTDLAYINITYAAA